jgi:hypothetical protein
MIDDVSILSQRSRHSMSWPRRPAWIRVFSTGDEGDVVYEYLYLFYAFFGSRPKLGRDAWSDQGRLMCVSLSLARMRTVTHVF